MKTAISVKTRKFSRYSVVRSSFCLWLILLLSTFAYSNQETTHIHDHDSHADVEAIQLSNALCPVMTGNKIDPKVFTEHKGQKVYFCCLNCKVSFEKNPEKYLHLLPQFSQDLSHSDHEHNQHSISQLFTRLTKPAGILTFTLLTMTVLAGLFRKKNPRFLFKWHKRLGIITFISATTHAILVLIFH